MKEKLSDRRTRVGAFGMFGLCFVRVVCFFYVRSERASLSKKVSGHSNRMRHWAGVLCCECLRCYWVVLCVCVCVGLAVTKEKQKNWELKSVLG